MDQIPKELYPIVGTIVVLKFPEILAWVKSYMTKEVKTEVRTATMETTLNLIQKDIGKIESTLEKTQKDVNELYRRMKSDG